ncbi:hypothetical protein Taro_026712 [Colocasia esculenta]|uniref:Uncharacterized protein n=1 Tax=Colocasia esculenta TaxID=4460 RepID=A0A843VCM2_COLES|nr:hypothetical protein [Colocasia esculenta]
MSRSSGCDSPSFSARTTLFIIATVVASVLLIALTSHSSSSSFLPWSSSLSALSSPLSSSFSSWSWEDDAGLHAADLPPPADDASAGYPSSAGRRVGISKRAGSGFLPLGSSTEPGTEISDPGHALASDTAIKATSVSNTGALAAVSETVDSEFQVVSALPGEDASDCLSVDEPSPLSESDLWFPSNYDQAPWEPCPVVWELSMPVVALPAPPLTITIRTTEEELVVAHGYIQLL